MLQMLLRLPQTIWRTLASSRVAKRLAMLAGGAAGAQAITLLTAPLLTRLYTPADLGVFAVVAATCSVILTYATLQYEQAIPVASDESEATSVRLLASGIALIVCLLLGTWLLILPPSMPAGWRIAGWEQRLWLIAPCCLFAAFHTTAVYGALRASSFVLIARARFGQSVARAVTELGLGLLAFKSLGLVAGYLAGHLIALTLLVRGAWASRIDLTTLPELSDLMRAAKNHSNFPRFVMPSATVYSATAAAPVFVIPLLYGPSAAGYFFLADRLTMWPVGLASNSIGQVFYGEITGSSDPERHRRIFDRLSLLLVTMGALGGIVLLVAPLCAPVLLGASWKETGVVMAALAPLMATQLLGIPLNKAHHLHNTQRVLLSLEVVRLFATLLTFAVAWIAQLSFSVTVLSYSAVNSLVFAAHWIMARRVLSYHSTGVASIEIDPMKKAA